MISVLNFKPFDSGSLKGFFTLLYHGLSIKNCRLMTGDNGLWFSFPQQKENLGDEVKYHDQMFLSPPERDHVTRLIVLDLEQQGHLDAPKQPAKAKRVPIPKAPSQDISDHFTSGQDDDIAF